VLGWRGRCRPPRPWICPKPAQFVASRSAKRDTEGHPDSVNLTVPPMLLDFAECDRARIARDPSYDGRFFTGVRTTGVYCRPVCPVRHALSKNVCYFPSAAAAELAGFRPCLRCRPETAPFCPAWIGTRATVDRAMRLIVEEGALDEEDSCVDGLAERLGVGA
jgi:AraC family transcriptional regulator of adaptative response / DNA-3-methyladenine glycosylase II